MRLTELLPRALAVASILAGTGCVGSPDFAQDAAGGASSGGGAPTDSTNLLQNPSFESGLAGWVVSGERDAAYVESLNPYAGQRDLTLQASHDYSVSVEQSLEGLPAGAYSLRAWVKSGPTLGDAYLFFRPAAGDEQRVAIPAGLSSALRLTLTGAEVTDAQASVGLHVEGPAGSWVALDAVQFFPGSPEFDPDFLLGGDVTQRRHMNDLGVKFHDAEGNTADVLDILKAGGFNLVRIRIHNDPGSPDHYPSNQFAAGYQNLDDAVANAKDCHDRGLGILLSFHYSDYWTNPGQQFKPYRWEGLSPDELEQAVYDYTHAALQTLAAQDTPPDIITLGNETNGGMIWPDGKIGSSGENFAGFARLFNAGARAVREVFPSARVAIHLSEPGPAVEQWLGWASAANLDYDVIGVSLYPFWSNLRVGDMKRVIAHAIALTGKQAMAVEVGFPWSLMRASGYPTLIASNDLPPEGLETFGVSPQGQELYLRSFFQQLHDVPGFVGASYWDPIWIDTPVLPSNVDDTTLFDWNGKALQGLRAFDEKFW